MTVIHFPNYTEHNPYQLNLANASSSVGESVVLTEAEGTFRIFKSYSSNDDVSVVHFHWLHPYIYAGTRLRTIVKIIITLIQVLLIKLNNTSVIWTVHNEISHESDYPILERLFKRLFIRSGICDHIIVHCEAVKGQIIEKYNITPQSGTGITVIPHGHYLDNYSNEISRKESRTTLGIEDSRTVFLFFGQITPYKGIQELIGAFKSVADNDSLLLIVGRIEHEWVEQRLDRIQSEDRIEIHRGFVPEEEVQVYMNAADVVVLPYRKSTTSGSVILAMSFSKPLIVPRLGCIPEMVDDQGAFLYEPDDQDGLSNALEAAQAHDLARMGRYNYEAVKRYDWEMIAKRIVEVYNVHRD